MISFRVGFSKLSLRIFFSFRIEIDDLNCKRFVPAGDSNSLFLSFNWLLFLLMNNERMHVCKWRAISINHSRWRVSRSIFQFFREIIKINKWKCSRVYCSRVFEYLISQSTSANRILFSNYIVFVLWQGIRFGISFFLLFSKPLESHLFARSFIRSFVRSLVLCGMRGSRNLIQFFYGFRFIAFGMRRCIASS